MQLCPPTLLTPNPQRTTPTPSLGDQGPRESSQNILITTARSRWRRNRGTQPTRRDSRETKDHSESNSRADSIRRILKIDTSTKFTEPNSLSMPNPSRGTTSIEFLPTLSHSNLHNTSIRLHCLPRMDQGAIQVSLGKWPQLRHQRPGCNTTITTRGRLDASDGSLDIWLQVSNCA